MPLLTFRSLFARKSHAVRPARRHSPRLRLESLEERAVPSTLTVDDNRAQNHNAQFTSIQDAVDHAHAGDTIKVYAGTYKEQVTIPNTLDNLRLVAVGGRDQVVIAPATFTTANRAIVEDAGAEDVEIRGFLITGRNAPSGAGQGAFYGVLVDNGGSATVRDNHVTFIRDQTLSGNQQGVGIMFGLKDNANNVLSFGSGTAKNNVVENYQKGGIVVAGTGSSATISGNRVKGVGLTAVIAQNGIQVSNGAAADVTGNTVSNNQFDTSGGDFESDGILIDTAGSNVRVRNNFVFANDEGIALYNTNGALVEGNTSNGNILNGILLVDSNNNTVRKNVVKFNQADGIALANSDGNRVEGNTAAFNADYGIEVDADSTGNVIRKNKLDHNGIQDLLVDNPNNTVGDNKIGGEHKNGKHGHHPHHRHHKHK